MLDTELKPSIIVDYSALKTEILKDLTIINKINVRWKGPQLVDLTIDGDGIHFYSYVVNFSKVERPDSTKEYNVTLQSRERYLKPVSFADAHCDSTKDFIVCILYSERVGSYWSVNKKKQIEILSQNSTTLAVWAKKDGKYQGNGLTYRLESIVPEDPRMSLIVGNYSANQISYMKRIDPKTYTDYSWKIKTVNLTNKIRILFNETVRTIKEAVYIQNMNITTNNWTSSARSIILTPAEYNKWYKKKLRDRSNTVALIVGGVFLAGLIYISFRLVRECMKDQGEASDITRVARDVLNRNASSLMTESQKGDMNGLPSDEKKTEGEEVAQQVESQVDRPTNGAEEDEDAIGDSGRPRALDEVEQAQASPNNTDNATEPQERGSEYNRASNTEEMQVSGGGLLTETHLMNEDQNGHEDVVGREEQSQAAVNDIEEPLIEEEGEDGQHSQEMEEGN